MDYAWKLSLADASRVAFWSSGTTLSPNTTAKSAGIALSLVIRCSSWKTSTSRCFQIIAR